MTKKKKQNGGCPLIRVCSLIRSNTVCQWALVALVTAATFKWIILRLHLWLHKQDHTVKQHFQIVVFIIEDIYNIYVFQIKINKIIKHSRLTFSFFRYPILMMSWGSWSMALTIGCIASGLSSASPPSRNAENKKYLQHPPLGLPSVRPTLS